MIKYLSSLFLILCLTLSQSYCQNVWTQKANFGSAARYGGFGFSIGAKGYIGAGNNGVNSLSDVWEYDPLTDAWTQKASLTTGRTAPVSFVIGNKGYICMGISNIFHNDLQEYDPLQNTWTTKANLPAAGRYGGFAFAINGKGYAGGGNPGNGFNPCLNDFYEYDALSDNWTAKTNFPGNPRYGMAGFTLGTKGYAGLGLNQSNGVVFYQDFYEYEPNTNAWTAKTNFPGLGRNYPTCFAIGNEGYLCGGESYVALADFYKYEPIANTWTSLPNYGGGIRWAASGFAIGNVGYAGTGNDFTNLFDDFWQYAPTVGIPPVSQASIVEVKISNGIIEINFSENISCPLQFEIYASDGTRIFERKISPNEKEEKFKLPYSLPSGVYFYLLSTAQQKIKSNKLIIIRNP